MEELTTKELQLSSVIISLGELSLSHVQIDALQKEARTLLAELELQQAHLSAQLESQALPSTAGRTFSLSGLRNRLGGTESDREKEGQLQQDREELRAHEVELSRLRKLLHQAVQKAKENLTSRAADERAHLLAQASSALRKRQVVGTTGELGLPKETSKPVGRGSVAENVSLANQVTASLRRSRNLLREEIERGLEANQVLEASSRHIKNSVEEHDYASEESNTAIAYLNRLRRRELTDRILLASALAFFCLTVLYVVLSRLLSVSLWNLIT